MPDRITGVQGIKIYTDPLEPAYFNQLVRSAGQPIRWWVGTLCACTKNGIPLRDCPKCHGFGFTYKDQMVYLVEYLYLAPQGSITVNDGDKITGVRNATTQALIPYEQQCNRLFLRSPTPVYGNVIVTATHTRSMIKMQAGIWESPYIKVAVPVECDINEVRSVTCGGRDVLFAYTNLKDMSRDLSGYARLFVAEKDRAGIRHSDVLVTYSFIEPIRASLTGINAKDVDRLGPISNEGDATLAYPSFILISQYDLVSSLSSIKRTKHLLEKTATEVDYLPVFDAKEVQVQSLTTQYVEGVDYWIKSGNSIYWQKERMPAMGTQLDMAITHCMLYRVIGTLPSSRGHQFRLFPERALLKEVPEVASVRSVL